VAHGPVIATSQAQNPDFIAPTGPNNSQHPSIAWYRHIHSRDVPKLQVAIILLNLLAAAVVETFELQHERESWRLPPHVLEGDIGLGDLCGMGGNLVRVS
jgi:hypothetical protein